MKNKIICAAIFSVTILAGLGLFFVEYAENCVKRIHCNQFIVEINTTDFSFSEATINLEQKVVPRSGVVANTYEGLNIVLVRFSLLTNAKDNMMFLEKQPETRSVVVNSRTRPE